MKQITVFKGRTNIVPVSVGFDVSEDTFASQIRAGRGADSSLLATWVISFLTDGSDGELILTLDNEQTADIDRTTGYMDIVRFSGGEPLPVFDEPLEVVFKESITTG